MMPINRSDVARSQSAANTRLAAILYEAFQTSPDITLIVLKGHLLIEEEMFLLVRSCAVRPKALNEIRLTFHQLAGLAEALSKRRDTDWIWQAIRRLNTLRNALAHQLEPADLSKRIDGFLEPFERLRLFRCIDFHGHEVKTATAVAYTCGAVRRTWDSKARARALPEFDALSRPRKPLTCGNKSLYPKGD
jgi:hypothetical protein